MKTTKQPESDPVKDITSGKFRDCYLIYNRKSLSEPNSQKNSIKYQRSENTRHAGRQQLSIAAVTLKGFCTNGVVSEKHSAFEEGGDILISDNGLVQFRIERPKFHQMAQYLSQGHFKGVICLCWDRMSRNQADVRTPEQYSTTGAAGLSG